jgi:hypothetical protein
LRLNGKNGEAPISLELMDRMIAAGDDAKKKG